MPKRFDSRDIRIVEALAVYGPRNISKLARKINMPVSTVRDRIAALRSHFSLLLQAKVYHTFIGLKKAFLFAKASPGCGRLLWESMGANEYWLYLTARYDLAESFYGIYGIPVNHTEEFEQFVKQIETLGIAENANLFWSTCIHEVSLTDNWYNHESERWVFRWDQWIKDIENQGTLLPKTLVEQKRYPQKADKIDIIILTELQKDASCSLRHIAKTLDISPQRVQYHFQNHVIGKELIEGYAVHLPHFEDVSEHYCFRFNFDNEKDMVKFALSFEGKPFVRSTSKIMGKTALFVHIYLPRKEFRGFTDCVSKLVRNGVLKDYNYAIEDPLRKQAETIPYQSFKNKSWMYNHKEHMTRIHELATQISAYTI